MLSKAYPTFLVLAFVLGIFAFSSVALAEEDVETLDVEDNKVSVSMTDTLVSDFVLNQPITWDRIVMVHNPKDKDKNVKIKFGKGAEVLTVPEGVKLEGKKKVKIKAPPGDSVWVIRFETAPITVTETVLNSDPANYRKTVTVSSKYHYTNIPALTSLPNLPATHVYSITPASTGQETRKVLYDNDGDGNKDATRWTVAHLSTEEFGVAAEKVPSRISNYKMESARADNEKLPDGWIMAEDITAVEDDTDWMYDPLETGYQSSTSLRIKHSELSSKRISSETLNSSGAGSFNISFDFNPQFENGATCFWNFGVEIYFSDGAPDTTYPFDIDSSGILVSTPGEYTTSVTPNQGESGWLHVEALGQTLVDADRKMRFYVSAESCPDFPASGFLIDNVVFEG